MAGAIAVTDTSEDPANLTTYTFLSQDVGAAAADRYVVVGASWREGAAADRLVASATIGGVAATILRQDHTGGGGTAIIGAALPTGTTADVVIIFNGANSRCLIAVARATGIDFSAVLDSAGLATANNGPAAGDHTEVVDVDTAAGGVVFGYQFCTLNVVTPALSFGGTDGLTEAAQQNTETSFYARAGTADTAVGQTPRDIDAIFDMPGAETMLAYSAVVVSFAPADEPPPPTPTPVDPGAGGGGRRRGRQYPYLNVIDDGWDWDALDARAEPKAPPEPGSAPPVAPEKQPERPQEPRKPVGLSQAVKASGTPVALPRPAAEPLAEAEPSAIVAGGEQQVAALEAEIESLRAQVAELKARHYDDEEEERLLGFLLES